MAEGKQRRGREKMITNAEALIAFAVLHQDVDDPARALGRALR